MTLASNLVPVLAGSERGTVLNLNVPAVPLSELRGVRAGTLGRVGLIRSARSAQTVDEVHSRQAVAMGGTIKLTLRGARGSDTGDEAAEVDPESDAGLVADRWASLTPILGSPRGPLSHRHRPRGQGVGRGPTPLTTRGLPPPKGGYRRQVPLELH